MIDQSRGIVERTRRRTGCRRHGGNGPAEGAEPGPQPRRPICRENRPLGSIESRWRRDRAGNPPCRKPGASLIASYWRQWAHRPPARGRTGPFTGQHRTRHPDRADPQGGGQCGHSRGEGRAKSRFLFLQDQRGPAAGPEPGQPEGSAAIPAVGGRTDQIRSNGPREGPHGMAALLAHPGQGRRRELAPCRLTPPFLLWRGSAAGPVLGPVPVVG